MISLLILLFVIAGCGHFSSNNQNQEYIPPEIKNQPRLLYPKIALDNVYTGNTVVIIHVSETGEVEKTEISKSSGYDCLDNAALEFCDNVVFYPASVNNKPVKSRISQEIKFSMNEDEGGSIAKDYVNRLSKLYAELPITNTFARREIQNKILNMHNEFILNMGDAYNFNMVLSKVLMPGIVNAWDKDWNSYPLSFLLYHDFIMRFPDYDSITVVKNLLGNSLRYDISYIKNSEAVTPVLQNEKEILLTKIKRFIKSQYPDISISDLEFESKINS
jgi:TonB family protein